MMVRRCYCEDGDKRWRYNITMMRSWVIKPCHTRRDHTHASLQCNACCTDTNIHSRTLQTSFVTSIQSLLYTAPLTTRSNWIPNNVLMHKGIDTIRYSEMHRSMGYMIPQMTPQNILETAELCREKSMRSYERNRSARSHNKHKGTEYFQTSGETRLRIRTDIKKNLPAQSPTHNITTEMIQSVLLYGDSSSLMADQAQTECLQTFLPFLHCYVRKTVEFGLKINNKNRDAQYTRTILVKSQSEWFF